MDIGAILEFRILGMLGYVDIEDILGCWDIVDKGSWDILDIWIVGYWGCLVHLEYFGVFEIMGY